MNLLKTLIFLVSALAVGCTSDQMIEEEAKPFDIKEPSIKVDGVKEGYVVYLHKKEEAYENKASSPVYIGNQGFHLHGASYSYLTANFDKDESQFKGYYLDDVFLGKKELHLFEATDKNEMAYYKVKDVYISFEKNISGTTNLVYYFPPNEATNSWINGYYKDYPDVKNRFEYVKMNDENSSAVSNVTIGGALSGGSNLESRTIEKTSPDISDTEDCRKSFFKMPVIDKEICWTIRVALDQPLQAASP